MSVLRIAAVAILSSVLLAACGGLRSKSSPTVTYTLRANGPPANTTSAAAADAAANRLKSFALSVSRPVAGPGLHDERIALSAPGGRLEYYAGSRWATHAPDLLGALLIETIRARGVLAAVHDDAAPFTSDFVLRVVMRRFDADYGDNASAAPNVLVILDCTLGTRVERSVVASFSVEASSRASANRMEAVVAAYERATQAALASVTEQSLAALSRETTE
jgi:cholesterol transport system auxiliary component